MILDRRHVPFPLKLHKLLNDAESNLTSERSASERLRRNRDEIQTRLETLEHMAEYAELCRHAGRFDEAAVAGRRLAWGLARAYELWYGLAWRQEMRQWRLGVALKLEARIHASVASRYALGRRFAGWVETALRSRLLRLRYGSVRGMFVERWCTLAVSDRRDAIADARSDSSTYVVSECCTDGTSNRSYRCPYLRSYRRY
mgnify:CR=1 FL=1